MEKKWKSQLVRLLSESWEETLQAVALKFEPMENARNHPIAGAEKVIERLKEGKPPVSEDSFIYELFEKWK